MYRQLDGNLRELACSLLAIKDSDVRLDLVLQGDVAIDKSVHFGGAFSEVIPLVTMFYGGFCRQDPADPTKRGGDIFVLSKGHGIAGMAAIFSDFGYFSREFFQNARSYESRLNGHPGPILPGVHVATGPLGQGISTAVGFAQAQQFEADGRTFCLMGDGEVQEGIPWEAFLYAGSKRLNNLCVVVDFNNGQNDNTRYLKMPLGDLKSKFESFGFEVCDVDGTKYDTMFQAFEHFEQRVSEKPMVIISNCKKGEGGFALVTENHKTSMKAWESVSEKRLQNYQRDVRAAVFCKKMEEYLGCGGKRQDVEALAAGMNLHIVYREDRPVAVERVFRPVVMRRAAKRSKKLDYMEELLPKLEKGQVLKCSAVISKAMAAFGTDPHHVTIDADMGNITGLQVGMDLTNQKLSLNTGIAESNMMGMSEAFAAKGYNVWIGTFGMFYDWRVLRRMAVSQQERMEDIASPDGWLDEGHTLDITMVIPASNLDTQVNGATHMSIDDATALQQVPHVGVIDIACPQMALAAAKWVAEGGHGMNLLRLTRADTEVIYDSDTIFEYGKGYVHGDLDNAKAVIITSGRGIYEAFKARTLLEERSIPTAVVDMPSYDEKLCLQLASSGKYVLFAEQNNGFLFDRFKTSVFCAKVRCNPARVNAINTKLKDGSLRFLHSGTYRELLSVAGLTAESIAGAVYALSCEGQ